jgi:hypothetical protein
MLCASNELGGSLFGIQVCKFQAILERELIHPAVLAMIKSI